MSEINLFSVSLDFFPALIPSNPTGLENGLLNRQHHETFEIMLDTDTKNRIDTGAVLGTHFNVIHLFMC